MAHVSLDFGVTRSVQTLTRLFSASRQAGEEPIYLVCLGFLPSWAYTDQARVNLTNVVWVEQPAGTGFSKQLGTPPATNELEVAAQFLGFFKNFVDTFGLYNKKIYISGESYAGYYVPYIGRYFLMCRLWCR